MSPNSDRDRLEAMPEPAAGVQVSRVAGIQWMRSQLTEPTGIGQLLAARLDEAREVRVLLPHERRQETDTLDGRGRGVPMAETFSVATEFFRHLGRDEPYSLVVEDDFARRGDPIAEGDVYFYGDRVLHMGQFGADGSAPVGHLRRSSSWYPLIAFCSARRACPLSMSRHRRMSSTACLPPLSLELSLFLLLYMTRRH